MNLEEHLKMPVLGRPINVHHESDWLIACTIRLPSGKMAVSDPMFMYQSDTVQLPQGEHIVEVKVIDHGDRRLISRLRVLTESRGEMGEGIMNVPIDSAQLGLMDFDALTRGIEPLNSERYEERLSEMNTNMLSGVLYWSNDAPMHYFSTGLGDGWYVVHEVVNGSKRIGIEVEFIQFKDFE